MSGSHVCLSLSRKWDPNIKIHSILSEFCLAKVQKRSCVGVLMSSRCGSLYLIYGINFQFVILWIALYGCGDLVFFFSISKLKNFAINHKIKPDMVLSYRGQRTVFRVQWNVCIHFYILFFSENLLFFFFFISGFRYSFIWRKRERVCYLPKRIGSFWIIYFDRHFLFIF